MCEEMERVMIDEAMHDDNNLSEMSIEMASEQSIIF